MMDCLWDDELMKQWEGVSKDEERINVRRSEGKGLQVENVQSAIVHVHWSTWASCPPQGKLWKQLQWPPGTMATVKDVDLFVGG